MLNRLFALSVISTLSAVSAFAGSAVATIDCKSASGATVVNIESEDLGGVKSVRFAINGEYNKYVVTNDRGEQVSGTTGGAVWELGDKVIAVNVQRDGSGTDTDYGWVQFWAMPGTVVVSRIPNGTAATFTAKIRGTDPRRHPTSEAASTGITVSCKLHYAI